MMLLKLVFFFFLLFMSHLSFADGILISDNGNVSVDVKLNTSLKENPKIANNGGCAFNKHDLSINKCKAFEDEKYINNGVKRNISYFIKNTPRYIFDVITFRTIRRIHKVLVNTLTTVVGYYFFLVYHNVVTVLNIYLKSKYRRHIKYILQTFLFRFLLTYILQLFTSFMSFHYFNVLSQKVQCDYDMNISRSQIFSRVIGFFELNLVNHYLVIFSETIQILFIRLLFNRYETCLVKQIIYNSDDYLSHYDHENKYIVLYFMIKKFLTARMDNMNLLNFNYLRYLLITNIFFHYFGGSYNKYCPSEVTMPGVYANRKKCIPKDMGYATKKELELLREYCKETGCHTCGTACHDKFIGDHQPPIQVVKDNIAYFSKKTTTSRMLYFFGLYDTRQCLYAQCVKCSQIQSAAVRCRKKKLVFHAFTIRFFHFACIAHLVYKMVVWTKWRQMFNIDDDNI